MKAALKKIVLSILSFMGALLLLNFLFMGNTDYQVVTLKEISSQSHYSIDTESADGSVQIIFKLPNSSSLAQKLKKQHKDKTDGEDVDSKNKGNVRKRKGKQTQYPVTLTSPYLINNPSICSNKKLDYVIIVHTSTDHFSRRRFIRQTWANLNAFKKHSFKIVFILGLTGNNDTQTMIENESNVHGDIVQGYFKDSYHNLTHKGVLAYRWVSEFCLNVDMVLKVDDDMFVNVFHLIEYHLPLYRKSSRLMSCHVRPKGTSPIARKGSKWTVKGDEFKNMTHYPVPYCNGYFVLMTPDIIKEMYRASFMTPFFWVDDVYLYGLLPFKAGKVQHKNIAGNLCLNQKKGVECFNRNSTCRLLASYASIDGYMEQMWFSAISMYNSLAKKFLANDFFT
ncbi:hypothetical protein FSP39_003268 [Pinctada imbricata]|uniref:Hexosyltransferase n=1 Tax=Pinctada imbricata TaxID=66713 RepID=A0AA88YCB6_PINIB|nr:hypothetical protein FSP39_003268 [Pinctada imbricata]